MMLTRWKELMAYQYDYLQYRINRLAYSVYRKRNAWHLHRQNNYARSTSNLLRDDSKIDLIPSHQDKKNSFDLKHLSNMGKGRGDGDVSQVSSTSSIFSEQNVLDELVSLSPSLSEISVLYEDSVDADKSDEIESDWDDLSSSLIRRDVSNQEKSKTTEILQVPEPPQKSKSNLLEKSSKIISHHINPKIKKLKSKGSNGIIVRKILARFLHNNTHDSRQLSASNPTSKMIAIDKNNIRTKSPDIFLEKDDRKNGKNSLNPNRTNKHKLKVAGILPVKVGFKFGFRNDKIIRCKIKKSKNGKEKSKVKSQSPPTTTPLNEVERSTNFNFPFKTRVEALSTNPDLAILQKIPFQSDMKIPTLLGLDTTAHINPLTNSKELLRFQRRNDAGELQNLANESRKKIMPIAESFYPSTSYTSQFSHLLPASRLFST